MSRAWIHLGRLWPARRAAGVMLPLPFVVLALVHAIRGDLRWEHVALALLVPLLAWSSATSKRWFVVLYPFGLVAIVYDAMAGWKNVGVTPGTVHVCDLHALESRLFGIGAAHAAPSDWFYAHSSPVLDVLCAIPYATFILWCIGFVLFAGRREPSVVQRFAWTFLLVNVLGFVTYHVYPAAPPWYYHLHGCAVDIRAAANEGVHLARVDRMLGYPYFQAMYARSSDVFGAVPSLHAAYPLLVVLFGWSIFGKLGRSVLVGFCLWMAFSAVYLDHHWVIDVVLGCLYAVVCYVLARLASVLWRAFAVRRAMPNAVAADSAILVAERRESERLC